MFFGQAPGPPFHFFILFFSRVTALRQNPTYVAYNSWFRLVIVGLIPFLLLMYLNMKVITNILC